MYGEDVAVVGCSMSWMVSDGAMAPFLIHNRRTGMDRFSSVLGGQWGDGEIDLALSCEHAEG
jgi:hypothetical protein